MLAEGCGSWKKNLLFSCFSVAAAFQENGLALLF
jgi:hypothetical protein